MLVEVDPGSHFGIAPPSISSRETYVCFGNPLGGESPSVDRTFHRAKGRSLPFGAITTSLLSTTEFLAKVEVSLSKI